MVEINSEITDFKLLAKNMEKLSKSFARTTLRTGLRNAGRPVRDIARSKAPVGTGDLRKGIRVVAKVDRDGEGYANIGFGSEEYYGQFQEVGTSQQPAQPFLRPALDEAESQGLVGAAFIESINKTVQKVIKKVS